MTNRSERSRRATAAAVKLAREHGLKVDKPVVLNDLFSLMLHLSPAPVVARVATCMPRMRSPIEDSLATEIAVTTFLAGQGAPVVTPSRELRPGPHTSDGFAISFWTYLEADPDKAATAADCSAMLVDLHAALRSYPGTLPRLGVSDIARGLELLEESRDVVGEDERALLRNSAERLAPFLAAPASLLQPLHGDAHPGNLVATRDGLVWIDFEDVCLGPVEWDLASMMDSDAVTAYHRPDPEILAQCKELRALQVALALIAFYDDFGDLEGWDAGIRAMLDQLR